MQIEQVAVESLIPYARNSRTHSDEQVAQIAASIKEFGWTNPILIDGESGIIAGHGRLLAARKLGMKEVPVIQLSGMTDTQKRAYIIADNKLALNAGWDDELLGLELGELDLEGFDLELTGFTQEEIDALNPEQIPEGLTDEDAVPELQADPVSKPGDVWILGKHRILCGDCRNFDDVLRALGGESINLAVTSPPYASQRKYDESSGFKPIHPDEYVEWYADVSGNIMANLAEDGSYICNIKEHAEDGERHTYVKDLLLAHIRKWGWLWIDEYVWVRQGIPGDAEGMGRFRNGWESVFWFARRTRPKFNPKDVRHESVGSFSYADQVAAGKKIGATNQGAGGAKNSPVGHGVGLAYPSNVLDMKQKAETLGHAAAFPTVLPSFFIKANSDPGDVVFDPFMGSGTTLIAAEEGGRTAVGTEISPNYVDVIVRRWQEFTGKQATLEATGQTFDDIAKDKSLAIETENADG